MVNIHQTAIVHSSAELDRDVVISPYAIIESDVSIGEGTWIGPYVVIRNFTNIGKGNRIFQYSSIGEEPQCSRYKGEPTTLEIGNRNTIREYCTFNRGTANNFGVTRVGDDNFIMAYVHIAHDCILGNNIVVSNGTSIAGHVDVGDYAIMGGFTLVHQFCKVGAHCITGIGTVCFQDVPPYIIAAGNSAKPFGINVKGLKRRNFSEQTINYLKTAYRILYRSNLDFKTALSQIDLVGANNAEVEVFNSFLRHSKRGIIR